MAFSLRRFFPQTDKGPKTVEVSCRELFEAAEEYRIRELAFWCCVNLIATAAGRCEFCTFRRGEKVRGPVYYLWNVEPNVNQNSTVFLHKLVATLYQENEALIVPHWLDTAFDAIAVADSWQVKEGTAFEPVRYEDVVIGQSSIPSIAGDRALHLALNYCDIGPVIKGIYTAYTKLVSSATRNYIWSNGQHWKVHVSQLASGQEGWGDAFQKQVDSQIRPFLNSSSSVLPELDGWSYENVDKGFETGRDASHIRSLVNDIFDFTANAFLIPPVLLRGQVEGVGDAQGRFLSQCIDPLMDQLSEEVNRKLYGYRLWKERSFLQVDTSAIGHFDLFANAANIEKLIGSGYSYNDVQRASGGQEINEPWADRHFITKNFDEAQNALKGEET